MVQLTHRQQAVYEFIRERILHRGYGPTVREIGDRFDIKSPNGVMCHLRALEKKGLIHRSPNKSRAIELTEEIADADRGLPLRGRVAAGVLHEAIEQEDRRIDFGDMFRGRNLFVLEVSGDSMVDANVQDGDFVVIEPSKSAERGQMVVARTNDGEATLKYWYPEKRRIRLQPANSSMKPIYVKEASVIGVMVGVVRNVEPERVRESW